MANKRIQLTYVWTDESALLLDLQKKVSATMTDWATEFYARYGFDVNVDPGPLLRTSVARLSKYALKKSDGERPDMRGPSDIDAEDSARIEEIEAKLPPREKALADARELETRLQAEADFWAGEKARLRADPTSTTAEQNQAADEESFALRALQKTSQRRWALEVEVSNLHGDGLLAEVRRYVRLYQVRRERELRLQLRDKFVNDKIGGDKRLYVVFCKPAHPPTLKMRDRLALGITLLPLQDPTVAIAQDGQGRLIWAYPFVIVNLEIASRRTVAHELVHATGRLHPDPIKVYNKIEKKVAKLPRGSLLGAPFKDIEVQYEETGYEYLTGEFDGASNDLMNYMLDDPDVADCILEKSDRDLLDNAAFFVVTP